MQVFHGAIISCDDRDSVHAYLVEERGRIAFVGDSLPQAYHGASVTELGGRALLPAFGDGHLHFSSWALVAGAFFDVREARDFAELGTMINDFAARESERAVLPELERLLRELAARRDLAALLTGIEDLVDVTTTAGGSKALVAFGASAHSVAEGRLITRTELDALYSDKPLYIICYDGHSSIGNSKLIEMLPPKVRAMRGFCADSGQLLHEAFFGATDYASSLVPPLTLVRSIIEAYDRLAAYGVGLIHTVEGIGFPRDLDVTMVSHIARAMTRRCAFQTRLFFQTMDVDKVLARRLPRIGGCFATALDGCFGVCDAALNEPYTHDPDNRGILFHTDEEVLRFTRRAHRAGLQIALHVIGDAAVDQAIMALEAAQRDDPRPAARHVLIHACLLSRAQLERCAELGIAVTLQPGFLISPLEPAGYLERILGSRVATSSPLRDMVAAGIHLSGGSDAPVTHPDPIEGIYGACNHPYDPGQSLTVQQALRIYTREVAWTSFDERARGTLEQGKIADMVILNTDPLALEPHELRRLKTEQLLLAGRPYEPGAGGVLATLYGGLAGRKLSI